MEKVALRMIAALLNAPAWKWVLLIILVTVWRSRDIAELIKTVQGL